LTPIWSASNRTSSVVCWVRLSILFKY
jgi:hypothetical protein